MAHNNGAGHSGAIADDESGLQQVPALDPKPAAPGITADPDEDARDDGDDIAAARKLERLAQDQAKRAVLDRHDGMLDDAMFGAMS